MVAKEAFRNASLSLSLSMSLSSWLGATLCSRSMVAMYSFKKESLSLSLSRSLSICSWIWATIVLVIWMLGKTPKLQLSLSNSQSLFLVRF